MSAIAGVALFSLMAKSQGPAELGQMAIALSVLVYGLILSNFGTDSIAIRLVSQDPTIARSMVANVIGFRLAMNLVVLVGGVGLALYYIGSSIPGLMAILVGSLVVAALAPAWLPQAMERSEVFAAYNFVSPATTLLLALALLHLGWPGGIYTFAIARVGGDFTSAFGLVAWALLTLGRTPLPSLNGIKTLAHAARPVGVSRIVSGLGQATDLLVVSFFVSKSEMGIYAASLRIYLLIATMSLLYAGVVFPAFSRAALSGPQPLAQLLQTTVKRAGPFALLSSISIAVLSPTLLTVIFGAQFAGSEHLLRIQCVAALFNFVGTLAGTALLAAGQFRSYLRNTLISTGILIISRIVLVAQLGITGAPIASAIAEAAMIALHYHSLRRLHGTVPVSPESGLDGA